MIFFAGVRLGSLYHTSFRLIVIASDKNIVVLVALIKQWVLFLKRAPKTKPEITSKLHIALLNLIYKIISKDLAASLGFH